MLGAAWQRGLMPVSRAAIERAIELNGVAVEANKQAFEWGRRAAHDPAAVETLAGGRRARPPAAAFARRADRAARRASRGVARGEGRRRATAPSSSACGRPSRAGPRRGADRRRPRAPITSSSPSRTSGRSRGCSRRPSSRGRSARRSRARTRCTSISAPGRSRGPIRRPASWARARRDRGRMTAFRLMARLRFLRGTWLDPFRDSRRAQARTAARRRVRGATSRTRSSGSPRPTMRPRSGSSACRRRSGATGGSRKRAPRRRRKARAAALRQFECAEGADGDGGMTRRRARRSW